MSTVFEGRLTNPAAPPTQDEISALLGKKPAERMEKLEAFLYSAYELNRELKFPFGDSYGWGYKYSHKSKMLCYLFFEKDAFTVTLSIGKPELPRLQKELPSLLPKTQELWQNRYPCGEGGWIHYRVLCEEELVDVEKLISIRKKPKKAG